MTNAANRCETEAQLMLCGARTRSGTPCQKSPITGKKRCRNHGGLSTGPKTAEGKRRSREAKLRHGRYSKLTHEQKIIRLNLTHTEKTLLRIQQLVEMFGKQKLTSEQLEQVDLLGLISELLSIYNEVRSYAFRILSDEYVSADCKLNAIGKIEKMEVRKFQCLKASGFIDWKLPPIQQDGTEIEGQSFSDSEPDLVELFKALLPLDNADINTSSDNLS